MASFDLQSLHNFTFVPNESPLGSYTAIFTAVGVYLAVVFGLKAFMKDRKRVEFHWLVVPAHNFFLSAWSLVMMAGMIYEITKLYLRVAPQGNATETLFCDVDKVMAKGMPEFWFYLFYVSKFYELLDTVIIALKKNPIIFLHVYHHCITILLVYVMLETSVAVKWIAMIANTGVHVPMYYYYGMSSMGYQIWWKKYMTTMQIIQFVMDIAANCIGLYLYLYLGKSCSGTIYSWLFGQAILVSFLVLFIAFYKSTYKKPASTKGTPAGTTQKKSE